MFVRKMHLVHNYFHVITYPLEKMYYQKNYFFSIVFKFVSQNIEISVLAKIGLVWGDMDLDLTINMN